MNDWQRLWPAPAKINLFLHIVGRRADGYHLLQTVFRFLDIHDDVHFSPRDDGAIVHATPLPSVPPEQDLILRAAELLRRETGTTQGVTITLQKRLPMGGGLGGGSSDAATTLMALNHLWQTGLPSEALQALGLTLGADVPIFIHGHSAFAQGIGEQFDDVSPPAAWYLLVIPPVSVPTPEIFRADDLCRNTPTITPAQWHAGFGHNDMEAPACRLYPAVAQTLATLRQHGPARMSGSGACCFGEFATQDEARRAAQQLPAGTVWHLTQGIDEHPLRRLNTNAHETSRKTSRKNLQ